MSHNSPKSRPLKPVVGSFHYPYTFYEKKSRKKSLGEKHKKQPKIAFDGTEHTVRTISNRILHRKLLSTLQRSPKKDFSPNKHQLRRPSGIYVSVSKKARKVEERKICEPKPKVQKVESNGKDSDFKCYNKSERKPVHVDIDKEATEEIYATLALLPNRSEKDETTNNGEARGGDSNVSVRRSNRTFTPPERLGNVPYF